MHKQEQRQSYRDDYEPSFSSQQRQLPPLQDIIKPELESIDRKPKVEEDWECSLAFVNYSSASTSPTHLSPGHTIDTSMPSLSQTIDGLSFCATNETMLSNSTGWSTASQYSSSHGAYASTPSLSQPYYGRPAVSTGAGQQNLPSLTEINLGDSSPGYSSRRARLSRPHASPAYYSTAPTDPLDIAYAKPNQGSYPTPFGMVSTPRTTYPVSGYGGWSPISDAYCYTNGQSWPPSMQYSGSSCLVSDATSIAGSSRRRRGNLPKHVTDILREWFHEHLDHPYPTEEDKQMLMMKTNLTISQISNWFINVRRRHWQSAKDQRVQMHKMPARH